MGFVEIFRNTEMNIEKRVYPGGAFDPLGLASKDAETRDISLLPTSETVNCSAAFPPTNNPEEDHFPPEGG